MPSETEAATEEICLLAQIGVGDRDAFRQLYARYNAPLAALALRMLGNVGEAEEVLQDTFVKIWRNASTYDARQSRPFTWSVTILRRTAIDRLRQRHQPPPMPLAAAETVASFTTADSPRQQVAAREDAERVRVALEQLPIPQRSALDLALFSGLTQVEIARRLAQPVGTVKTWIRRGLLDLRAALKQI